MTRLQRLCRRHCGQVALLVATLSRLPWYVPLRELFIDPGSARMGFAQLVGAESGVVSNSLSGGGAWGGGDEMVLPPTLGM